MNQVASKVLTPHRTTPFQPPPDPRAGTAVVLCHRRPDSLSSRCRLPRRRLPSAWWPPRCRPSYPAVAGASAHTDAFLCFRPLTAGDDDPTPDDWAEPRRPDPTPDDRAESCTTTRRRTLLLRSLSWTHAWATLTCWTCLTR